MERRSPIATCILFFAGAAVCAAQESRATLIGRATDPSGAILTGATVRAINLATNAEVASTTNESGNYEIPYLLSGVYTVIVEMPGFKKVVRNGIQLRVSDRVTLDFTMTVGDVAETVTVTAETPLLEASTADMGLVMEQRRVQELPVIGGNPFYLTRLSAGVLASGGRSAGPFAWAADQRMIDQLHEPLAALLARRFDEDGAHRMNAESVLVALLSFDEVVVRTQLLQHGGHVHAAAISLVKKVRGTLAFEAKREHGVWFDR